LGVDGYAIISFWVMLQLMLGLLDFGVGPTIIREFSVSNLLANSSRIKSLLKSLEVIYGFGSLLICLFFIISANWLASSWLNIDPDQQERISNVIRVMGISLGLQFPYSLYINGMLGFQMHRKMNYFQILGNSLRYGLGVVVLLWKPDLFWFFVAQVLVSFAIIFLIRRNIWAMICFDSWGSLKLNFEILNEIKKFTLAMGINSILAVLIASSDRLILSKMETAYEFGTYALAFTAAGLLQLGIQPFYRVYFPRFSELSIRHDIISLRYEYFKSCELLAAVLIPLTLVGLFFSNEILSGWLGEAYPTSSAKIFQLLLIGICFSGLGWLPAALQQSQGATKLHIYMMLIALVVGIPLTIYSIFLFGAIGATVIWITHGVIEITIGLWLMHKKFFVGDLFKWYRNVIFPPLLIGLFIVLLSKFLLPINGGRYQDLIQAIGVGCFACGLAVSYHFVTTRLIFLKERKYEK
jgi:O-antigen/teichoic acid export membrane protein